MPRTSEKAINTQIAALLETMHPLWRGKIRAESTAVFGRKNLSPDILVTTPLGQPIIIETEVEDSPNCEQSVEADARRYIGLQLRASCELCEQALLLILPRELRDYSPGELRAHLPQCLIKYALLSLAPQGNTTRFPEQGWLRGRPKHIANMIECAAVSERRIKRGLETLQSGIAAAAERLEEHDLHPPNKLTQDIGALLRQEAKTEQHQKQTRRMAMAILINALVFHLGIEGKHTGPPAFSTLSDERGIRPDRLQRAWENILRINYHPIFSIALQILRNIPPVTAWRIFRVLNDTAHALSDLGVTDIQDISGRAFQRLISDRKFLATFYTLPESAALLAELLVQRAPVNWRNPEQIRALRIADFACGTGTLISAAYQAVLSRIRRAGHDDGKFHRYMIEHTLTAADIMPAAAHLASAQLAGAHPGQTFGRTRTYLMPYGVEKNGANGEHIRIGSLALLDPDAQFEDILNPGYTELGGGEIRKSAQGVPDHSLDLVIMNPPFARSTGQSTTHTQTDQAVPNFAAFGNSKAAQRKMAAHARKLYGALPKPTAANGNAGEATQFIDLANRKLKVGGVLALILPFTAIQGTAWENTRKLLRRSYRDIFFLAISTTKAKARAFSADTGMAETMVVATRTSANGGNGESGGNGENGDAIRYINLYRRPRTQNEAREIARIIQSVHADGPQQTTRYLSAGKDAVGTMHSGPITMGGCAGLLHAPLIDAMRALENKKLELPQLRHSPALPVCKLGELGRQGPYHADIGTPPAYRLQARGPFQIYEDTRHPYPVLWANNSAKHNCLVVAPEHSGRVAEGRTKADAEDIWMTANRLHYSADFGLSAGALAACLTREDCIGGRAWPSFLARKKAWEKALVLWANSTLGLLSFWWLGTTQQPGRAAVKKTVRGELLTLDPRELSAEQIRRANRVFTRFAKQPLLPANQAYEDKTRQALDRALLVEVLGLPAKVLKPLATLRLNWCREPSVHGGKSTKPPPAKQGA